MKKMKKKRKINWEIIYFPLILITLPIYALAYGISKLFFIKGNENMPTIFEWMDIEWYVEKEN